MSVSHGWTEMSWHQNSNIVTWRFFFFFQIPLRPQHQKWTLAKQLTRRHRPETMFKKPEIPGKDLLPSVTSRLALIGWCVLMHFGSSETWWEVAPLHALCGRKPGNQLQTVDFFGKRPKSELQWNRTEVTSPPIKVCSCGYLTRNGCLSCSIFPCRRLTTWSFVVTLTTLDKAAQLLPLLPARPGVMAAVVDGGGTMDGRSSSSSSKLPASCMHQSVIRSASRGLCQQRGPDITWLMMCWTADLH